MQVSNLGAAPQKYQEASQNENPNVSAPELQNNCNTFVTSACYLAKALEVPLVNDLGYTKRYVRCLQISEVVNSMKDLIDYCRETRTGPMGIKSQSSVQKIIHEMMSSSQHSNGGGTGGGLFSATIIGNDRQNFGELSSGTNNNALYNGVGLAWEWNSK